MINHSTNDIHFHIRQILRWTHQPGPVQLLVTISDGTSLQSCIDVIYLSNLITQYSLGNVTFAKCEGFHTHFFGVNFAKLKKGNPQI